MLKRAPLNFAKNYANTLQTSVQLCPKNLPFCKGSSFKIHHSSCVQSFMLEEILSEDVNDCIDKLKPYAASGLDQISPNL